MGTKDPSGLFKVIPYFRRSDQLEQNTTECFALAERENKAKWDIKKPPQNYSTLATRRLRLTIPPLSFFFLHVIYYFY